MISKKILAALAVAATSLTFATGAIAATNFAGTFSVDAYDDSPSDNGLEIHTSAPGSFNFSLEVGDNTGWFDLFDIWTPEGSAQWDDFNDQPITVDFSLTDPSSGSGMGGIGGDTSAQTVGLFTWGSVDWDPNSTILYFGSGDTGQLMIELKDTAFNKGPWLNFGGRGGTVQAKATYLVAPVPLPAAGLLLLGALGGIGVAARRRKAA